MYLLRFNVPITLLLLSFFFLLFSLSSAYNITQILEKYPDYSIFNDYLTQTQVSNQINEHRVMTVLVANNEAMSSLVGKSMDLVNKVMRIHVFLDFYTLNKFKSLPTSNPTKVTTLFESPDQQRYLNITNGDTISIVFAAGSNKVQVVRDISPDDIYQTSVVQVSNVIIPSSLSTSPSSSSLSPSSSVPLPPSSVPPPPSSVPSSSTFNITKILYNYPDFSQFNTYLTDTQLCDQINAQTSVTILVVNNAAMASLVGKSTEVKKRVLSLHVIMDYYTFQSFHSLPTSKTTQLTTLLQASFQSTGFQGLLNATNGDTVSIVSAVGSDIAELVKDVYTENLKISVVQINNLIVPSNSPSPPSSPFSSSPSPSSPSPLSPSPSSSSSSSTFDITKILTSNPDFNLFNNYLTQTQVANQINERKTMTLFVVNNGAMSPLVDKPMEIKKKVLSLHILMDYYTIQKLHNLPVSQPTRINTLLQVTDQPSGQQGFVNVTNGNAITIVSAAGSDQAVVVRDVADEINTISVVQISNLILPSRLTAPTPSSSSTTSKSRSATPVKAPSSSIASAPNLGGAPLSNAPISDAPTSVSLAPDLASIVGDHTVAAPGPLASGTLARFSINCVFVITMIFVSTLSLTSMILV